MPFHSNIDNPNDQEVPSFDLMSLINSVMGEEDKNAPNRENSVQPSQKTNIQTATTNTNINNVPRSMFANCSIGNIIFQVKK